MNAKHYEDFAAHLVARHGPQTVDTIGAVFKSLGNIVPDDAYAIDALKKDARLSVDDAGTISLKPADAAAKG